MDRVTETRILKRSVGTPQGRQDLTDVVMQLLTEAATINGKNEPGCAWVEGELAGMWCELRVTLRPRPEMSASQ